MRKTGLINHVFGLASVALTLATMWIGYDFLCEMLQSASIRLEVPDEVKQLSWGCFIAMLIMGLLFVIVLGCQKLVGRMSTGMLEATSLFVMSMAMVIIVLTQHRYVGKLLGHPFGGTIVDSDGACISDSHTLLIIDGVVTGSHLGLPIRWHVLVCLEVVGVMLYSVVIFAIGSTEMSPMHNLALLTAIILASSISKRAIEMSERKHFLDILRERRLRCEAEFQLTRGPEPVESGHTPASDTLSDEQHLSVVESLPKSTATGEVFDALYNTNTDLKPLLVEVATFSEREHWRIRKSEVTLLPDEILGEGGFGMVMKGIFCGIWVAVKVPRMGLGSSSASGLKDLCNEMRALRRLRHPNICTVHGAIIDPGRCRVALVLELVNGADLRKFIEKSAKALHSQADFLARYKILIGVCRALIYMHTRVPHIVHSDLKASNILVESASDSDARPVILDFGLARVQTHKSRLRGGTLAWMAPEVLCNGSVDCSADVYSLGHIIAFTCTGVLPMSGISAANIKKHLLNGRPIVPAWPSNCPYEPICATLVSRCLAAETSWRPTALEVHSQILHLPSILKFQGDCNFPEDLQLQGAGWDRPVESNPMISWLLVDDSNTGRPSDGKRTVAKPEEQESHNSFLEATSESEPAPAPPRRPTGKQAMLLSLCEAMSRWRLPPAEGGCCSFHEHVKMAQDLCRGLQGSGCKSQPLDSEGEQCAFCGIVGLEPNADCCDLCGQRRAHPER